MKVDSFWLYLASLCLGTGGALFIAVYGERWSLIDVPNQRSSHESVTPRGGGIGILAAFIFCSIACAVPFYFWVPAFFVAMISFFGDRSELSATIRLLAQFSLAFCFLFFIARYHFYSSGILWGLLLFLFYLVFIVGTANYYNFMDGINGIAAITGMVAFGLLGWYGTSSGKEPGQVILSFAVMAACAGFLPFNVPRARVFMGDVGSVLLGFVFASLVVMMSARAGEFILLAGFLFPFYADELVTMWERIREGERLTRPHRRHLYQVLANEAGLAHWWVSAGYGLVQLIVGLSAWHAASAGIPALLGVLALFFAVFVIVNNRIKGRYLAGG